MCVVPLIHLTSGQVCVHRVCGLQTVSTAIKKLSFRNVTIWGEALLFCVLGISCGESAANSQEILHLSKYVSIYELAEWSPLKKKYVGWKGTTVPPPAPGRKYSKASKLTNSLNDTMETSVVLTVEHNADTRAFTARQRLFSIPFAHPAGCLMYLKKRDGK